MQFSKKPMKTIEQQVYYEAAQQGWPLDKVSEEIAARKKQETKSCPFVDYDLHKNKAYTSDFIEDYARANGYPINGFKNLLLDQDWSQRKQVYLKGQKRSYTVYFKGKWHRNMWVVISLKPEIKAQPTLSNTKPYDEWEKRALKSI